MNAAIRVDRLSKRYRLGGNGAAYRTLRESLSEGVGGLWRRWRASAIDSHFWALRDVDFTVAPGEVVGVIGRNGAGKSTLLKVLSRITEPTEGRVELRGRLGSLLEIGTGFHPELTGRENVYLSGAILGMTRRDIARRFDDIVAFAGVEAFLDTPVKRYSSGMYVRLAFSVAAHLEPDILLVDEVLAVGDATYQRRCVERMADLARSGRTILFVSHNMDLIPRLCTTGILLEKGRVARVGPAAEVVEKYLTAQLSDGSQEELSVRHRTGDGRARFTRLQFLDGDGQAHAAHVSGEDLCLRVEIDASTAVPDAALAVVIKTLGGARLVSSWTRESGYAVELRPGKQVFDCCFRAIPLRPGQRFAVALWLEAGGVVDSVEDARTLEVIDGPSTREVSTDPQQGAVLCDYQWGQPRAFAEV